ncbi:hypothetical protein V8E36_000499 [Tilletia maclaganii]
MTSTASSVASSPQSWEVAVKQRDQSRAERDRFQRVVQQELVIQAASMSKEEMPSCTKLFDEVVRCYALFPQIRHIYRYGNISDCADKSDNWKACLMLRGLDGEEKYKAWIQRRAEIAAHKRLSKESTEEVWSFRTGPHGEVVDPDHASETFPNVTNEAAR